MANEYSEIKNRYRNILCNVSDHQMFQDIQVMIAYIDILHTVVARQAQIRVAEEALRVFADECTPGMKYPN